MNEKGFIVTRDMIGLMNFNQPIIIGWLKDDTIGYHLFWHFHDKNVIFKTCIEFITVSITLEFLMFTQIVYQKI